MKYYRVKAEDDQRKRYTFTSQKAASGAARFYHADGAKVVRLEKHVKEGPTTVSKHTIFELSND